jgi:hypothetical protein
MNFPKKNFETINFTVKKGYKEPVEIHSKGNIRVLNLPGNKHSYQKFVVSCESEIFLAHDKWSFESIVWRKNSCANKSRG